MQISKETEKALILKLLDLQTDESKNKCHPYIGKLVMVRTYSAGVHFGTLKSKEGEMVILENAHRVHYWACACSLSQLAMEGDKKPEECRISMAVDTISLEGVNELIPMPQSTFDNLTSKIWKK